MHHSYHFFFLSILVPGEILPEPTTDAELETITLKDTSVPTTILTNHSTR